MHPLLAKLSAAHKNLLHKRRMPVFEQPMLATLTKHYFSDKNWIYECKFDGVRCLLLKNKKKFILKSRNDKNVSLTYPELVQAAESFSMEQIVLDGEIVSFVNSISNFAKLQPRSGVQNPSPDLIKKVPVYLCVFDILYLDGYDLTDLPLLTRKKILKQVVSFKKPLRYVSHRSTNGLAYFKDACKKGWEGIIAKQKESRYEHKRSQQWLKFKCIQEQELIICGYTLPQGSRIGFGALLVGYFKNKKLYYAGKVGTGYNEAFLSTFIKKLQKIEIRENEFANPEALDDSQAHFVKPYFVGQFGFEEWTRDNKLRQGRFLGLRYDKDAKDVKQEIAEDL